MFIFDCFPSQNWLNCAVDDEGETCSPDTIILTSTVH